MIVSRDKLIQYAIPEEFYFARRSGEGNPISRNEYFNINPGQLVTAEYCAIGNDTDGWELEMYNGTNWVVVAPDTSYSLIITNDGLAALTNVRQGTTTLRFSGIKIIDQTILEPSTPIVQWTDTTFLSAGNVVFSAGTLGSAHPNQSSLTQLLKWRINSSSGGLQYILTLPADGLGSTADDNSVVWKIGAIGLYVKDPNDQTTDVLFAVATLPELITKRASDVNIIGNTIKLYFNTILTNLGIVSNLEILPDANVSLPEVQNETLLTYPKNIEKDPYNCYVVDNLYGTNMPCLAIKRDYNLPEQSSSEVDYNEWVWLQPNDNFMIVPSSSFDNTVLNYDFVYWDTSDQKYKRAQGQNDTTTPNAKMPIGIRVGNSIVFSGTVTNNATSYEYTTALISGGASYAIGDELLLPVSGSLTIKIVVTAISSTGAVTAFTQIGPTVGNLQIPSGHIIVSAVYDPRSQLPRNGTGLRINVIGTALTNTIWNFPASYLNKPVYCSATNPGKVTTDQTDSMVGWCVASNSIKLGMDVRNEASETRYGTVQYATDNQVKEVVTNAGVATKRVVCPQYLKNNYLQITKPTNTSQAGSTLDNPIIVNSYVKFNTTVLGKNTVTPNISVNNPYASNQNIDFYGTAFRAWYKDLAEYYEADKYYEPGTLITFGKGIKEISIADKECNGIISSHPGYELGMPTTETSLPVALTGRVPVLFDGNCIVRFGDKVYLSKIKPGCASTVENGKCIGKVIAKNFGTTKLIECVVRIDF